MRAVAGLGYGEGVEKVREGVSKVREGVEKVKEGSRKGREVYESALQAVLHRKVGSFACVCFYLGSSQEERRSTMRCHKAKLVQ